MFFNLLSPKTFIKWSTYVFAWLIFSPLVSLQAQSDLSGRDNVNFRLNQLRTEVLSPHGQQPPYEWSAVYLQNVASNIQPEAGYVLDSSVCGQGIVNTNQFGEEVKVYYSYNNDGQLSQVDFYQETTPGLYAKYSRKSYLYNSDGQKTSYLYQLWDEGSSTWKDDYEEMTTYNNDGKQTSFTLQEMDISGQWQGIFQEGRNYDASGNLVEILSAKWDNNAWLDTARKEVVYNSLGLYTKIYDESWNGTGWDTLSRETAAYDDLGIIWEGYLFEQNTQSGYEGVLRENYQYDNYGFWTGMNRQVWNNSGNTWENNLRETYNYNRSGLWIGWIQEVAKDTGWVNNLRQYYNKNGAIREDLMQTWDTTAGTWNNDSRALTRFDSSKNLKQEAGIQEWDSNTSSWVNNDKSRTCLHAWSEATSTNIEPQLSKLDCTLPNPYRMYEPIHCESLKPGKPYDIRLIDIQGRTVYQKTISGGDLFSIDRSLSIGIYHLSIFENQQMRFLRKIIINH